MSDQLTTQPTAPAKRKRVKSSAPRAQRVIDPGIAELRRQHNDAVAALKDKRRSAAVLKTILDKGLAQLTNDDKNTLFDFLKQTVTPALPIT